MNLLDKVWTSLCVRSLSFSDFKHSNVALMRHNAQPCHIEIIPEVKQLDCKGRGIHMPLPHFVPEGVSQLVHLFLILFHFLPQRVHLW